MAGLVPSRPWRLWEYQTFNLASTSSAKQGSLVMLDGARNVAEYVSTSSHFLGIQMHDSANSLPTGKCVVAVPVAPGARFWASLHTGESASAYSVGQARGICRNANGPDGTPRSFLTTLHTSVFSQVATVAGPIDSVNSRVECTFVWNEAVLGSNSSVTII